MSLIRKSFGLQVIFFLSFLVQNGNGQLGAECWSTPMCNHPVLNCVNFVCTCWDPFLPNQNHTLCTVPLDGVCRIVGVCYDPNASCQRADPSSPTEVCLCNAGFTNDPDTRFCKPLIGSNCTTDGTPCIDGSCSTAGICECPDGYTVSPAGDRCGVPLLGSCNAADPNCAIPNAECNLISNTCQCKQDYQQAFENNILSCKTALGAPCDSVNQCAPSNTDCEVLRHGNSACTCQHGYVPSESRDSCLAVTNHWPGTCQENRQCSAMFGRYSVCQSSSCVCETGYTYSAEDFSCVLQTSTVASSTLDAIRSLVRTMLPYLPSQAKIAVENVLIEQL